MDLLDGLNAAQREAVTATEGYVRVLAGAGSGKTRALTHRFAYLVGEVGVLPSNILCVTFTNKAANEMRRRIRALTGDNDTGFICTFHSFCVTLLQEEAHAVGYPEKFIVLDNSDIDAMLALIYEERGLTLRQMTFSDARDMIEMRKNKYEPHYYEDMIALPLDLLKEKYDRATEPADVIFYGYLYQEKKCFGLDYNDLLLFTLHIFDTDEAIRLKWQKRLEYVMIDEFQDIDKPQYRLMRALCAYHRNLFVVGDPDQTIYTWRGADVRFLLDFDKEFPGTRTIFMTENYRSSPEILALADSLISHNRVRAEKTLIPVRPASGETPVWFHEKSPADEALRIVRTVRELAGEEGKLSDFTVLYRSHFISRTLEEVFLREKMPYYIYSGTQFYDRAEIKDALSYLRLVAFRDDLSFARVVNRPKRNIGERRMRALREYAEENGCSLFQALRMCAESELFASTQARSFLRLIDDCAERAGREPISELLSRLLDKSGYEHALRTEGDNTRLDNLAELKQAVYEYETTCGEETDLASYLEHIALYSAADDGTSRNAVRFMTVHTAKGLEFPNVFLVSMSDSIFPSKKTDSAAAMEEERRLAFVAVTRARDRLFFTDSEGRGHDGDYRYPSRFLLEIDRPLLRREPEPDEALLREAAQAAAQSEKLLAAREGTTEFSVGDRIRHSVMGEGEIVGVDDRQGAYLIKFDILPTERKISFRAKLERIE